MNWLTSLFSQNIGGIIDSIGKAIDENVTSDEERLALKNQLVQLQLASNKDIREKEANFEKEITKRWVSDNESLITRLVRPVSYFIVLFVFLSLVFTDGNVGEFKVKEAYTAIMETLMVTMTIAYFGGRSYEKGKKYNG